MRLFTWTALCALAFSALGCEAAIDGTPEEEGPDMPNGGTGGGGGGTTTTNPLDRDAIGNRCTETALAPPQLRRLTAPELERTLRDVFPPLASGWAGVHLGADPTSTLGFSNDARMLVVAQQTAKELLDTAEEVATTLTTGAALGSLVPCAAEAAPGRACADQVAQALGSKLFRRPVATDEVAQYGALFDSVASKSDFATGAKWMLVAMMQSPSTIYRSELGSGSGTRKLAPYELASALSYTFGGTVPSAELLAAADRGELAAPAARVAAAKKLLETPAGLEQLRTFLAEWSGYARIASKTKTTVAGFDTLRDSMLQETSLFLGEAVVNRRGGVRELLTANYTFLNGALAGLYGFGPTGATTGFELTERPAARGLGLLAQGSILAGSAHSDTSSPTLRGLVVYERLLCHQRVKPPPGIPTIDVPTPGVTTTRQRYEVAHGGKPGCSACHKSFDPIGFGFEHFDEAGRYRDDEHGLAIDSTGQVLSTEGEKLFSFNGLDEMTTQLATLPEVADCVSGLAAAYAFAGAGGRACLAEEARARFASGELGVLDYYAELAAAPSFIERR